MKKVALMILVIVTLTGCGSDTGQEPCSAETCPGGCCSGDRCRASSAAACGIAGGMCINCEADTRSDACVNGDCVCGATGERCAQDEVCQATGCAGDCQPDCAGRQCGDDGCGGSCGTCDAGQDCQDGQCLSCEPECTGRQCGDDGCGGSCGTCDAGQDCQDGQCVGCEPECTGRECGDDACGGSCGTCDAGQTCEDGQCIGCQVDCAGKCAGADDGCGGSCAANDCGGCCNTAHACVAFGQQTDTACGSGGDACLDCAAAGLVCDATLHACTGSTPNDAQYVDQSVPSVMAPGERVQVQVTMLNVGSNTWLKQSNHRLGSQNPQDNTTWGTGRVDLGDRESVVPGEEKTFTYEVVAPDTPGVYAFQWRMVQDGVEWFGDFTPNVSVAVESSDITVCESIRALAGTQQDASGAIQACIDATPADTVLELPAGIYRVDHQVRIHARAITVRTEGTNAAGARCALESHGCAELRASAAFGDTGGILQVQADGSAVDHLVVHGDKAGRSGSPSAAQCAQYNNFYGHNMRMTCNDCSLSNSVTQHALCGTGCEVAGAGSGVTITRNTIAYNGVHNVEGMWADGLTVHAYAASTFTDNEIIDNTDVDLIFGACTNCIIQNNVIWHTESFAGSTFAAMMIHTWPGMSGDYTGADISGNSIDCGAQKRCGFGLYLGSDAWYITDVHGGSVHDNTVRNAEQGVLIDDVHDMEVYNNPVTENGSFTRASCGYELTSEYSMGSRSYNVDRSRDTLGTTYTSKDWDGCIPNWWDQ